MHQIHDLKHFLEAYTGSYCQAYLFLQAIEINRRERLSDRCIEYLSSHVANAWEAAPKTHELIELIHQLLDITTINKGVIEHALGQFCSDSSGDTAITIVCPSLTLLVAADYLDRLKLRYAHIKGTSGCARRLMIAAYLVAAKYMHANLRLIVDPSSGDRLPLSAQQQQQRQQELQCSASPTPPPEEDFRISRLELELIRFLNYNLFVPEPSQLVWWARTWDEVPTNTCNGSSSIVPPNYTMGNNDHNVVG